MTRVYMFSENHVSIYTDDLISFQSYESIVCTLDKRQRITLGKDWDYSKTTTKHLIKWLEQMTGTSYTSKELKQAIKDGDIAYDPDMK